ncbi:MAG: hypothetical protein R2942_17215 [Ignavibacteria bacterium]
MVATGYETNHMKGYQNLLLGVTQDKWSLNTSLLTQEDIVNKSGDGFDYSFYNLYIKGSNLWNALDVGIGRQYIFAGVGILSRRTRPDIKRYEKAVSDKCLRRSIDT